MTSLTDVDRQERQRKARARAGLPLDVPVHPSLKRADTVLADVEGLLHKSLTLAAADAPLLEALAQPWGSGDPLVWLAERPPTEIQALEKGPLNGATVKVSAAMGTPATIATWTDVSRQAAAHAPALAAIIAVLDQAVIGDTDRAVASALLALSATAGSGAAALSAVAAWPGPKLVVLSPNGAGEAENWARYASLSGGALTVIADPYITQNLCIATAAVAVGVLGPHRLTADQPSHLGVDVSSSMTYAVQGAAGAVATWVSAITTTVDEVWIGSTPPHGTAP